MNLDEDIRNADWIKWVAAAKARGMKMERVQKDAEGLARRFASEDHPFTACMNAPDMVDRYPDPEQRKQVCGAMKAAMPDHSMAKKMLADFDDELFGLTQKDLAFDPARHPRHPEGVPVDPATGAGGGRFARSGQEASPMLTPMHEVPPRQWIAKGVWTEGPLAGQPLPENTLDYYGRSTNNPEREALREKMITDMLGDARPSTETPVMIVMFGAPGAGKSTIQDSLLKVHPRDMIKVDSDVLKEQFPEYQQAINQPGGASARNAAWMVHAESKVLANEVARRALAIGANFLFDGTGTDPALPELIATAKENGYRVHAIVVHNEYEIAAPRILDRAERTGRYVPLDDTRRKYDLVPSSFRVLADQMTEAWVFDNRQEFKPKLAMHFRMDGTKNNVWDEEIANLYGGTARSFATVRQRSRKAMLSSDVVDEVSAAVLGNFDSIIAAFKRNPKVYKSPTQWTPWPVDDVDENGELVQKALANLPQRGQRKFGGRELPRFGVNPRRPDINETPPPNRLPTHEPTIPGQRRMIEQGIGGEERLNPQAVKDAQRAYHRFPKESPIVTPSGDLAGGKFAPLISPEEALRTGGGDSPVTGLLKRNPLESYKRNMQSESVRDAKEGVNISLRGQLKSGVTVTIKPENGQLAHADQTHIRDFVAGHNDIGRELAAQYINDKMGKWVDMPTAVERTFPDDLKYNRARDPRYDPEELVPIGRALVLNWREGKPLGAMSRARMADVRKMALFDAIIGNTDRHAGNALIAPDGHMVAIDHGLAFPRAHTPAWGNFQAVARVFMEEGPELHKDEIAALDNLIAQKSSIHLGKFGITAWEGRQMWARVDWMKKNGKLFTKNILRKSRDGWPDDRLQAYQ